MFVPSAGVDIRRQPTIVPFSETSDSQRDTGFRFRTDSGIKKEPAKRPFRPDFGEDPCITAEEFLGGSK